MKALAVSAEARQQTERHANLVMRMAALTAREREVARRVARGQTNPAIAADLNVALRTIKLYRQHAMEKLGAGSLAELVRIADELGM